MSTTSYEVSPRWMKRESGPTFSATDERKAMMSCLTTLSISSIRGTSNPAFRRMLFREAAGILPRLAQAPHTASSTSSQRRYLLSLGPDGPHFGIGIAFDHAEI